MGWSVLGNCISYSHGLMHLLGSKPLVAVGGGSFPATTLNSPEQSSWACKHVLGMEKILHLPPPCSWIMFRGCSNKGHFTRRGNSGSAHQWKRNIELQGLFFFFVQFSPLNPGYKKSCRAVPLIVEMQHFHSCSKTIPPALCSFAGAKGSSQICLLASSAELCGKNCRRTDPARIWARASLDAQGPRMKRPHFVIKRKTCWNGFCQPN